MKNRLASLSKRYFFKFFKSNNDQQMQLAKQLILQKTSENQGLKVQEQNESDLESREKIEFYVKNENSNMIKVQAHENELLVDIIQKFTIQKDFAECGSMLECGKCAVLLSRNLYNLLGTPDWREWEALAGLPKYSRCSC